MKLLDEINSLKKDIQEKTFLLKELEEKAKNKIEENKCFRWRGNKWERYFFINISGTIDWYEDNFSYFDDFLFNSGNYFKTEEEAELYRDKMLIRQELEDLSLKSKVKNKQSGEYYIYYSPLTNSFISDASHDESIFLDCYFASKTDAIEAIKTIGENKLKILFEIKE